MLASEVSDIYHPKIFTHKRVVTGTNLVDKLLLWKTWASSCPLIGGCADL